MSLLQPQAWRQWRLMIVACGDDLLYCTTSPVIKMYYSFKCHVDVSHVESGLKRMLVWNLKIHYVGVCLRSNVTALPDWSVPWSKELHELNEEQTSAVHFHLSASVLHFRLPASGQSSSECCLSNYSPFYTVVKGHPVKLHTSCNSSTLLSAESSLLDIYILI